MVGRGAARGGVGGGMRTGACVRGHSGGGGVLRRTRRGPTPLPSSFGGGGAARRGEGGGGPRGSGGAGGAAQEVGGPTAAWDLVASSSGVDKRRPDRATVQRHEAD